MNRIPIRPLLGAAALVYLLGLGSTAFWDKHWESRRALIARTMVEERDFLVPRQNGEITLKKPPLYYWTVAGAMAVTGNHEEWGARLPSALAGVAGLAVTWRLGVLLAGPGAGGLAALLLLVNVLYFGHARTAEMDMLLLAVETAALWAFFEGRGRSRRGVWVALGWMFLAVGFLIKGPVGVLVPAVMLPVYALADGRRSEAPSSGWIRPGRGLLLFFLLVLPWFVAVMLRFSRAFSVFFEETVRRYGGELDHKEPFWFYVPVLLAGFLPGTLLLPAWVREARRRGSPAALHLRRLAFILGILVLLFSLSGSKRIYYVLPLWPLLALGAGIAADAALRTGGARLVRLPVIVVSLALAAAAGVATVWPSVGGAFFYEPGPLAYGLLAVTGLLALGTSVAALRGRWHAAVVGVTATFLALQVFAVLVVAPPLNAYRSRAGFARAVALRVPDDEPLYMFKQDNFALVFYARRVMPNLWTEADLADVVKRHGAVHVILDRGQAETLEAAGYRVEREFSMIWRRPGRKLRERDLSLARVSAGAD